MFERLSPLTSNVESRTLRKKPTFQAGCCSHQSELEVKQEAVWKHENMC